MNEAWSLVFQTNRTPPSLRVIIVEGSLYSGVETSIQWKEKRRKKAVKKCFVSDAIKNLITHHLHTTAKPPNQQEEENGGNCAEFCKSYATSRLC